MTLFTNTYLAFSADWCSSWSFTFLKYLSFFWWMKNFQRILQRHNNSLASTNMKLKFLFSVSSSAVASELHFPVVTNLPCPIISEAESRSVRVCVSVKQPCARKLWNIQAALRSPFPHKQFADGHLVRISMFNLVTDALKHLKQHRAQKSVIVHNLKNGILKQI